MLLHEHLIHMLHKLHYGIWRMFGEQLRELQEGSPRLQDLLFFLAHEGCGNPRKWLHKNFRLPVVFGGWSPMCCYIGQYGNSDIVGKEALTLPARNGLEILHGDKNGCQNDNLYR